ncbi:hypothetical protein [Dinghuibacter silviterrae]|uniref:Cro/C1-type helix-turn-helix DNA-binding protein n=1 Tax=Dinghuibacter silviterrae TaxID=1539049 RepID=A0A4R8DTI3_9BACT|nr:hypothetical protein [Dinghuibacter silviterrae]TDX01228.1 hypothetical protein EDB95_2260 [Dinghuibacter silviterrae]
MKKPNYYSLLKTAMENGTVEFVRDIPRVVPITQLTHDMRMNYNTLSKRLLDPSRLTLADLQRLATLLGVDSSELHRKVVRELKGKR